MNRGSVLGRDGNVTDAALKSSGAGSVDRQSGEILKATEAGIPPKAIERMKIAIIRSIQLD